MGLYVPVQGEFGELEERVISMCELGKMGMNRCEFEKMGFMCEL